MIRIAALLGILPSLATFDPTNVCYDGFVMDRYCIDRGTLLDNPSLSTLDFPDKHSVHCLVDVASCRNSVFEMLSLEPNGAGTHCRAYALDNTGRDLVTSLARSTGICSTCSGGAGSQTHGFAAVVVGTVENPTDSTALPLLRATQILPTGSDCPNGLSKTLPNHVECSSGGALPAIIAHGSLMMLSWGFLLPLGVVCAHFLRHRENALWFSVLGDSIMLEDLEHMHLNACTMDTCESRESQNMYSMLIDFSNYRK
jgi:hypothetical protein